MCIMNKSIENSITSSLEQMVEKGKLVYDFNVTAAIQRKQRKRTDGVEAQNRISIVMRKYTACFEEVRLTPENSHHWLQCSILRLKLNNYLIERLLRDLIKRCSLHIRLLSGADAELYVKRASLLFNEIAKLEKKVLELSRVVTTDIEKHWVEGEVHALETEFYQQKEHKACKMLWGKLREEETRLKLAIEKTKASSGSASPAEGMRVPFLGSPVDINASSLPAATDTLTPLSATTDTLTKLPATTDNLTKFSNFLSSVDSDFIVLGICALVLIGGTLYFRLKDDDRGDDGHSGGGGKFNKSRIAPVSGLKELVPPAPADSGGRDVTYLDFRGLLMQPIYRNLITFYYGESVVGHESVVWTSFGNETVTEMQPIWRNMVKSVVGESVVVVGKLSVCFVFSPIYSFLHCAFFFVPIVLCLCCLPGSSEKRTPSSRAHVRPYILLTLSYVVLTSEVQGLVGISEIIARITKTFSCRSVIVGKTSEGDLKRYNVGINNSTASRYTAATLLRSAFPEFEEHQLEISFRKGWNLICFLVLKGDSNATVWGEEPLKSLKHRHKCFTEKRQGPDLANLLRTKNSWEEVLADDRLVNKCLSSYNSVRNTFDDLQDVKSKNSMSFFYGLWQFVKEQGGSFYSEKDLREVHAVLDWLVLNLCRPRHLRQKQLLILGLPGTQKTLLVHCLSQFLDVYFVPRRANDFTGGNKHYNLWVIDEFNGYETNASLLNMILDGQKVALDMKYGKIFTKDQNVPIMLLGNNVPLMYNSEAFHSRVVEVHFFSEKEPLEAGRLASTLLRYCIWYSTCNKANGEGLKALGYHLLTENDLFQLSERAGFRLHSIEVLSKMYDRLPTVSRLRYLKWFGRFDNAAKAQLRLPRDEAEYAKKVALSNPRDHEVELIELARKVEKERGGEEPEQEQRTLCYSSLNQEQQELGEPEQVCEDKNLSDSEQEGGDPDDPWAKAYRKLIKENQERKQIQKERERIEKENIKANIERWKRTPVPVYYEKEGK